MASRRVHVIDCPVCVAVGSVKGMQYHRTVDRCLVCDIRNIFFCSLTRCTLQLSRCFLFPHNTKFALAISSYKYHKKCSEAFYSRPLDKNAPRDGHSVNTAVKTAHEKYGIAEAMWGEESYCGYLQRLDEPDGMLVEMIRVAFFPMESMITALRCDRSEQEFVPVACPLRASVYTCTRALKCTCSLLLSLPPFVLQHLSHTHTHTHTLTHSLTHTLTYTHSCSLTHTLTLTHSLLSPTIRRTRSSHLSGRLDARSSRADRAHH
jgi:hypothetical protein